MSANDPLVDLLSNSRELETFLHEFISQVAKQRPKSGASVTKYAAKLRLTVPTALQGANITWAASDNSDAAHDYDEEVAEQTLVFARSGYTNALGFIAWNDGALRAMVDHADSDESSCRRRMPSAADKFYLTYNDNTHTALASVNGEASASNSAKWQVSGFARLQDHE